MDWKCTIQNDFVMNGFAINNNSSNDNNNRYNYNNEITLLYRQATTSTTSNTNTNTNINTNTKNIGKVRVVNGSTKIIHATCSIVTFVQNLLLIQQQQQQNQQQQLNQTTNDTSIRHDDILNEIQNNRIVQIALCDYIARTLNNKSNQTKLVRIINNNNNTNTKTNSASCEDNDYNNNAISTNNNNTSTTQSIVIIEPLYKVTQTTNNKHIVQKRYNRLLQQVVKMMNHNSTTSNDDHNANDDHNDNDDDDDTTSSSTSFVFERTDVSCCRDTTGTSTDTLLHVFVRCYYGTTNSTATAGTYDLNNCISTILNDFFCTSICITKLLHHIGIVITQEQIRLLLEQPQYNAVAFIANGSILPRKSSIHMNKPMSSPPAISFIAPPPKPSSQSQSSSDSDFDSSSIYNSTLAVPIGIWKQYLNFHTSISNYYSHIDTTVSIDDETDCINNKNNKNSIVLLDGLLIPKGITLIVGGGYHGKSTLLRCIACSIYNKIPGDGRELCVSISNAVTIRSEDGRYVNNCNISAFISNLPTITTSNTTTSIIDTKHFSTNDASGSTSQSSNVIEAIEFGCTCMLLDEDTSATNFMARDGRMRSLIQNECITPLLYRVNGLYNNTNTNTDTNTTNRKSISFIVVVGGVGDWLDVPHNVILINNYICTDVTSKAKSISKQFSHGHVQYAGQGVVHQLQWPLSASPIPRIPTIISTNDANKDTSNDEKKQTQILFHIDSVNIRLLDGTNTMSIHNTTKLYDTTKTNKSSTSNNYDDDVHMYDFDSDDEDDDDDNNSTIQNIIDLSRCEQLLGKKQQLYGCGICVVWILYYSQQQTKYKNYSISQFLDELDTIIDSNGFLSLFTTTMQQQQLLFVDSATSTDDNTTTTTTADESTTNYQYTNTWNYMINNIGYCYRPRRYEIGQALTRLRNKSKQQQILQFITVKQIEEQIQQMEQEQMLAETQRKEQLLNTWNTRKQKRSMKDTLVQEIITSQQQPQQQL